MSTSGRGPALNAYNGAAVAADVNVRAIVWGLGMVALGIVLATDLVPGSARMATGPRIGIIALLITLGVTTLLIANAAWVLRRTTRPEDYEGGCPVGASCGKCGAFNLKPRTSCRSCGVDLAVAGSETFDRDGPVDA